MSWKDTLPKIVAVDFDGTLVEDKFPEIGSPITAMFNAMVALKNSGVKLILWSCRDNESPDRNLDAAVEFCRQQGLEFDAVNTNIPELQEIFHNDTRKVYADLYIDDKAVTPFGCGIHINDQIAVQLGMYYSSGLNKFICSAEELHS